MADTLTRRAFLKGSLAGTAYLGLAASPLSAFTQEKPPNFVIIFCDDLGYNDLGCFGSPLISTPRIDRMASEGMKLTDFYVAAPVCTPSRAALVTGCYPLRVSLPQVINYRSKIGINSDEITIAELLKTQGYATACIGKWHLGWQSKFLPTKHGFDHYYGLPYSNDMNYEDHPVPLMRGEEIIEQPAVQETLTERYTDEAVRFIRKNRHRPFFLYLPHTFPHVPLFASERFTGKSKRGLYGDVVETIDWSTGKILDTLKELGLDDNTFVVFTSDNGPWMVKGDHGGCADPLRGSKGSAWEGGMRVPAVIRWPGRIPAGRVCSEVATSMDLYPTIANLAGARIPTDRIIDGMDIRPLIEGRAGAVSPRESFFYYDAGMLCAVRSGRWKLMMEHVNGRVKETIPFALYDLRTDIGETTDLSARYPSIVSRLQAMLESCRQDLGDSLTKRQGANRRPAGTVES